MKFLPRAALGIMLCCILHAICQAEDTETKPPAPATPPFPAVTPEPGPGIINNIVPLTPTLPLQVPSTGQTSTPEGTKLSDLLGGARPSVFQPGAGPPIFETFDQGEIPTLKSGPNVFHPSFTHAEIFNDNFFGTNTNPRESYLLNYSPGFAMKATPHEGIEMNSSSLFTYHEYTTSVVPSYFDFTTSNDLRIKHFFIEDLSFSLGDVYTQVGDTVLNPLAEQIDVQSIEIVTGERYESNSAPLALKYKSEKMILNAAYTNNVTDYFSSRAAAFSYIQSISAIDGEYRFLPNLSLFGKYSFIETNYGDNPAANFNLQNSMLGVKGKTNGLDFTLGGGFNSENSNNRADDITVPGYVANLSYTPSEHLNFTLLASKNLDVGVRTGQYITTINAAVLNLKPIKDSLLSLTAGDQDKKYQTGDERIKSTGITFNYNIGHFIKPVLGVTYVHEDLLGGTQQIGFTYSASVNYKMGYFVLINAGALREDVIFAGHRRVTDTYNLTFDCRITHWASANMALNHTDQDNLGVFPAPNGTGTGGDVKVNTLRFGFRLTW